MAVKLKNQRGWPSHNTENKAFNGYTFVYPLDILHTMAKKDVGLRIRVARDLRNEFLEVCHAQDKSASQILREFMLRHIEEYRSLQQRSLFDHEWKSGSR